MPDRDDSFFNKFHFSSFQKEDVESNTNIVNIWSKTIEIVKNDLISDFSALDIACGFVQMSDYV